MRKVNSPPPDDISGKNPGDAGRLQWMQQVTPAVQELLRMMGTSVSAAEVEAAAQAAAADAKAAIPTADAVSASATVAAGQVVGRRVASAVNATAVTVPGLGTVDVALTLTPALVDDKYVPVTGTIMTNTTTLLGLVSILGVTARTASTMTVRLRNTGATAAVVPAGAITAAAIHPNTT